MKALRLLRIELTVANLDRAERFYTQALGFASVASGAAEPAMAGLLGADAIRQVELRRAAQTLLLQQFQPRGAAYPDDAIACDQSFQHFAMPVADMAQAMAALEALHPAAISAGGPQRLPPRSGGAVAFKFRDLDGHPLELIQFPDGRAGGIDHSAVVVVDADRSVAFYRDMLGLAVAARQLNIRQGAGPARRVARCGGRGGGARTACADPACGAARLPHAAGPPGRAGAPGRHRRHQARAGGRRPARRPGDHAGRAATGPR